MSRIRRFASRPAALVLAALCISPAIAADEVNIYSYRQPFLIEPIFDAFTDQTGIDVNVVYAKAGLVERLAAEGRNSPADLLLVSDIGTLTAAVDQGLTQVVHSEVLDARIPAQDRDPDGRWFGLTKRARLFVTSRERVEPGLVQSYADLAKPALKGRVCTRSAKHDYMIALIASRIAHEGIESTEAWLRGVKANLARKPQGNERAQVRSIAEGECDVAVINSYYIGAMTDDATQKPWVDAVNIVFPDQDGYGTHMNVSGVVMTKAAPNRDNALKLMEFMVGDDAQGLYAGTNHEYPVVEGIARSPLVASWGEFKADPLLLADIARHRTEASKLVDRVDYDG